MRAAFFLAEDRAAVDLAARVKRTWQPPDRRAKIICSVL